MKVLSFGGGVQTCTLAVMACKGRWMGEKMPWTCKICGNETGLLFKCDCEQELEEALKKITEGKDNHVA